MKSDIEIARSVTPLHINQVAEKAGIMQDELIAWGDYKAKVDLSIFARIKQRRMGFEMNVKFVRKRKTKTGNKRTLNIISKDIWRTLINTKKGISGGGKRIQNARKKGIRNGGKRILTKFELRI